MVLLARLVLLGIFQLLEVLALVQLVETDFMQAVQGAHHALHVRV